jgi:hypothetical protein
MTENVSTSSQRTKHVDVKYHFVRKYMEDGFIKIFFVRSEHIISDGFTKDVTGDITEFTGYSLTFLGYGSIRVCIGGMQSACVAPQRYTACRRPAAAPP